MTRHTWDEISAELRRTVVARLGSPVVRAETPSAGRSSDLSLSLVTEHGTRVFVKGTRKDSPTARMHHNEVTTYRLLPPGAPVLLWTVNTPEWLILGYEHVTGRHADFSPGSPDLGPLARLLTATTAHRPTLDGLPVRALAARWSRVRPWRTLSRDRDALDTPDRDMIDTCLECEARTIDALDRGDLIVHADVHELNMLIHGGRARLIDWGWACRGPAWIDPACAVIRLVGAGHAPRDADQWAEQIPAWRDADRDDVTRFAVALWGMWRYRNRFPVLIDAARDYARYRLG